MGRGKSSRGARKVERKAERSNSSSPYILDRNLTPRIEEYALNHDITDVDDVVDHLRRSYREYQRKQLAALRQMVVRAVQSVQQRGVDKPELQLQVGGMVRVHLGGCAAPPTKCATATAERFGGCCCVAGGGLTLRRAMRCSSTPAGGCWVVRR
jgi:hypothetical protein